MNPRPINHFPIPAGWTTAQAEAVFDFLAHLADAVFAAYHDPITQSAYRDAITSTPPDSLVQHDHLHPDDDILF